MHNAPEADSAEKNFEERRAVVEVAAGLLGFGFGSVEVLGFGFQV